MRIFYPRLFSLRRSWLAALSLFLAFSSSAQSLPGAGNSLVFNGSSYLSCGTSNRTITSQVTIEAWIKTTSSDYQWIVGKYLNSNFEEKGFHLYTNNGQAYLSGRISRGVYLSSGASSTRVNDGRWHHIAGATDGSTWRIYVDGVLENTATYGYSSADFTTTTALTIGNYAVQNGQYFQGDIDEVRVWRTARTTTDIIQNMCRKFATAPADLVAYYRFDQSSGVTATDQGSQPTNGTLVGFAGTPWHLSGAALGDVSLTTYQGVGGAASIRAGLLLTTGDSAVVNCTLSTGNVQGVQVYAVNSAPSIVPSVAGSSAAYVGVFTTGSTQTYSVRLRPASGPACRTAQQRTSNDLTWNSLPAPTLTPTSLLFGPFTYRGEYILVNGGIGAPVSIVGDSAVCGSTTGQLVAAATGATGYRWSTGATTAAISGLGPGTYSVTATFAGGCTTTAQTTIRAARSYAPIITGDSVLCGSGRLTAAAAGPVTYRWSTGATTASISVTQAGTYTVTATSPAGCSQQTSYRVRAALAAPTFTLGADTTLCDGAALTLTGPAGAGLRYLWSDGSTNRQLVVTSAGTYTLRVSNQCSTTQAARAVALRDCLLIPNILTANGDGRNDVFFVQGLTGSDWSLDVFNRWGRAVLHTDSYRNDWGADAAPGIYYVLLRRASTGRSYKGWVEVMR